MPFTFYWICATRDGWSLSMLQLQTRWPFGRQTVARHGHVPSLDWF